MMKQCSDKIIQLPTAIPPPCLPKSLGADCSDEDDNDDDDDDGGGVGGDVC